MHRGGRDNLATVMNAALNDWLDRAGRSWTWPVLTRRTEPLTLGAGLTELTLGAGSGGITRRLTHVIGRPWILTGTLQAPTSRSKLALFSLHDSTDALLSSFPSTGRPRRFAIERLSQDQLKMVFDVVTDQPYLLNITTHELEPRIVTGTTVPWYPEDETMIQAVMAATLRQENGPESPSYQAAIAELTDLMATDKIRHGTSASLNTTMGLDEEVYRR